MVQVALAKESVLWKRGWYTFPPVRIPSHWLGNCTIYPVGRVHTPSYRATYLTVHDCLVLLHQYKVCLQSVPRTLKEMQDLQTRLAALDVVIRQVTPAPDHAPHYTSIGRACHLQQALGGSRRCSKPKAFSFASAATHNHGQIQQRHLQLLHGAGARGVPRSDGRLQGHDRHGRPGAAAAAAASTGSSKRTSLLWRRAGARLSQAKLHYSSMTAIASLALRAAAAASAGSSRRILLP